jgi:hypothetical protein
MFSSSSALFFSASSLFEFSSSSIANFRARLAFRMPSVFFVGGIFFGGLLALAFT